MDGTHPDVLATKASLKEVMESEVRILRELLGSMYEEQQAHLTNNAESLRTLLSARERLLVEMSELRDNRLSLVSQLHQQLRGDDATCNPDEPEALNLLTEFASTDACEILSLRDQMLALLDQMTEQGNRNNYLLEGKVAHTKELLQRIHPNEPHPTYSASGSVQKKAVKTKVSIINREV